MHRLYLFFVEEGQQCLRKPRWVTLMHLNPRPAGHYSHSPLCSVCVCVCVRVCSQYVTRVCYQSWRFSHSSVRSVVRDAPICFSFSWPPLTHLLCSYGPWCVMFVCLWLQVKCDQYWPSRGTETYGMIQVSMLDTVELATYSVRTFALYKVCVWRNWHLFSFFFCFWLYQQSEFIWFQLYSVEKYYVMKSFYTKQTENKF